MCIEKSPANLSLQRSYVLVTCHYFCSLTACLSCRRSFAKSFLLFLFTTDVFLRNCLDKRNNRVLSGGLNKQVALFTAKLHPQAAILGIQGSWKIRKCFNFPPLVFIYAIFLFGRWAILGENSNYLLSPFYPCKKNSGSPVKNNASLPTPISFDPAAGPHKLPKIRGTQI